MRSISSSHLVFLDESGAHLGFCRDYARTFGGQKIKMPKPYPRGHAYTMISAIGLSGVRASLYGQWHANGDLFTQYIEYCLVPQLKKGDILVMDNVNLIFIKRLALKNLLSQLEQKFYFYHLIRQIFLPLRICGQK